MFRIISRSLLVAPLILSVALPAFAAGGLGKGARPVRARSVASSKPIWNLKIDGQDATLRAKAGSTVALTLRGDQLVGASALLSIRKFDGTIEVLPFLSAHENLPLVIKFSIPQFPRRGAGQMREFARRYEVKIVGRTKSGEFVASNTVKILVTR